MNNMSSDTTLTRRFTPSDVALNGIGLDAYRSIGGIEVTLTAELCRRSISVQELLRFRIDDIIVFSRPAGENVDFLVADVVIGGAEILATDEKLTVRIASILGKPTASLNQDQELKRAPSRLALHTVTSDEI